jgi:two-component system phosphate regulon sensor histidine kinase PhoR
VIRLAADLGTVDREAAALRGQLAWAGLAALVGVLPLALWLARAALRPLREIAEVVDSIARGDLERRLPRGAPDELGRIAAAVNQMGEQLRARLRELTEDKERLQAVLSGMVEGVLVVDSAQRVVLANPRLRELFGFRGGAVGRPLWEVVRRSDVQESVTKAALQADAIVGDVTTEGPEPRHLQLHAVRFPSAGPLLGVVAVFHDLTELRRLERMRRDFVANVSHELKTPLTAIRGFAETLRGSELPPPQRQAYLDVILRHAERLARLIDDILELSRVEGRQQPFSPSEVDVARVATVLLRDMQPQLEARGLRAELAPGARGLAWADRRAVEQILSNLLDNACKYTEPGGRIEVRVAEAGGQVRLEVEDAGIGIPAEDLPRIFERFYRVDKARSRDLGGTGLGLAIVKHLAQAQGGEVSVRSRPGAGSTFTVTLPRAHDAARLPQSPPLP